VSARWTVKWIDGHTLKLHVFQCKWGELSGAIDAMSFGTPFVLSVERAPELVL
jgi:hypothetical protein